MNHLQMDSDRLLQYTNRGAVDSPENGRSLSAMRSRLRQTFKLSTYWCQPCFA